MNPVVTVLSSVQDREMWTTVLEFEEVPKRPLSPAWIGWPVAAQPGPETKRAGRLTLHRLTGLSGARATFETEAEPGCTPPPAGMRCNYYSWWDEDQLELVRDRARVWTLTHKESNWECTSCELCWERLAPTKGARGTAFRSGVNLVCPKCHDRFFVSDFGLRVGDLV